MLQRYETNDPSIRSDSASRPSYWEGLRRTSQSVAVPRAVQILLSEVSWAGHADHNRRKQAGADDEQVDGASGQSGVDKGRKTGARLRELVCS